MTKTAWDVLSRVANLCGIFCRGCQKMAWDVLSWDVLSGFLLDMYNSLSQILLYQIRMKNPLVYKGLNKLKMLHKQ